MSAQGFWSYVRADDDVEKGRITELARDVAGEYQMQTGDAIDLFIDRDEIQWGDNWRKLVDENLSSVAFFIAVLTPRYFLSSECRRELQGFARRATSLGIKELVLPLLYVDVSALHQATPEDDLMVLVRTFQWEDWRELRFTEPKSERYRTSVARMASRLIAANQHAEQTASVVVTQHVREPPGQKPIEVSDEGPGVLDRVADAELALPELNETLASIAKDIELVGQLTAEAGREMERRSQQSPGFTARILVARRLSQDLLAPVDRIRSAANSYATQLHDIDVGFRTVIEEGTQAAPQNPVAKASLCEFFAILRALSTTANQSLGRAQQLMDTVAQSERMSRDLRPVFRNFRQALAILVESRGVTDEWVHLIETTGIDCEAATG